MWFNEEFEYVAQERQAALRAEAAHARLVAQLKRERPRRGLPWRRLDSTHAASPVPALQ